jgi:hypothetical protein
MDVEINNLYAPPRQQSGVTWYTSLGYMHTGDGWETGFGKFEAARNRPEISESGVSERVNRLAFPDSSYEPGPAIEDEKSVNQWENFIACMRSRNREDLYCDILEGHLSVTLAHLANISYRTGRKLQFDPDAERFVNDDEANGYLTREYRAPYVMPKEV